MKTKKTHIDPEKFVLRVWTMEGGEGAQTSFLVCERSVISHQGSLVKDQKAGKVTSDFFTHPVAVALATPCAVFYSLTDKTHTWRSNPPESQGISRAAAKAAMAEAYRGIEKIATISFPQMNWHIVAKTRWIASLTDCAGEHEQSMFRAVNICLHWDHIKRQSPGSTLAARWQAMAEMLDTMGIPTGWRQVKKITEKHGI
jgi:hypothetical protein